MRFRRSVGRSDSISDATCDRLTVPDHVGREGAPAAHLSGLAIAKSSDDAIDVGFAGAGFGHDVVLVRSLRLTVSEDAGALLFGGHLRSLVVSRNEPPRPHESDVGYWHAPYGPTLPATPRYHMPSWHCSVTPSAAYWTVTCLLASWLVL